MRIPTFGALALVMMAAVAYAQRVDVDSDPMAPFASYTTYAWTMGTPSSNPLADDRIHAAVDTELAGKGMTKVQTAPSMFVATHVVTQEEKQLVANGFGPWGFGGFASASVETYVKGTLVVDLYDASTKKLVWRGVATDTPSDKASKNNSKIDKAVEKMFDKYPPSLSSSRN